MKPTMWQEAKSDLGMSGTKLWRENEKIRRHADSYMKSAASIPGDTQTRFRQWDEVAFVWFQSTLLEVSRRTGLF